MVQTKRLAAALLLGLLVPQVQGLFDFFTPKIDVQNMCPGFKMWMSKRSSLDIYKAVDEKRFYSEPYYKSYIVALYGFIQTLTFSQCYFIVGDVYLDLRVPHAMALSSMLTNMRAITGTFTVASMYDSIFTFPELITIVNQKGAPVHMTHYYYTDPRWLRSVMVAGYLDRFNGDGVSIAIKVNVRNGEGFRTFDVSFREKRADLYMLLFGVNAFEPHMHVAQSGLTTQNCGAAGLRIASRTDIHCCQEECRDGCTDLGQNVHACLRCADDKLWSFKHKRCVPCGSDKSIANYCINERTCPPPMVLSSDGVSCEFGCQKGESLMTKVTDSLAGGAECKKCSFTYLKDIGDLGASIAQGCLKTCTHYGLITTHSRLQGCTILVGHAVINQWSYQTERGATLLQQLGSVAVIYGTLTVHGLPGTEVFDLLPSLQHVEGKLIFMQNTNLRQICLPSASNIKEIQIDNCPVLKPEDVSPLTKKLTGSEKGSFFNSSVGYKPCTKPSASSLADCSDQCQECGPLRTSWDCKSCRSLAVDQFNMYTCVPECPVGWFKTPDNKCHRCHRNCYKCNGPDGTFTATGCSHCQIGFLNSEGSYECFPYIALPRAFPYDGEEAHAMYESLQPADDTAVGF